MPASIGQAHINNQLCKWLEHTTPPSGNQDHSKVLNDLNRQTFGGYCKGYCQEYLIKGATQWETELKAMAEWNGSPDQLNAIVNQETKQTLNDVFAQAAINIYKQQHAKTNSDPTNNLTSEQSTKPAQNYLRFSGNMDQALFTELIQQLDQSNLISLSGKHHRCALRVTQNKYYYYNPNCPTGEKEIDNTEILYKTVIQDLSSSMTVHVTSTSNTIVNAIPLQNIWGKKNLNDIFKGEGIHQIAYYTPEFLSKATMSTDIITALNEKDSRSMTGWSMATWRASAYLQPFINTAINNGQKNSVIDALCIIDKYGYTGWERLATKAPQQLQSFIDMITTPDQRQNIISALCEKDIDNQQTGWERLATKAPQQLQSFIDMITTPDQRQNVISALCEKDIDNQQTGWERLATKAPQQLQSFIDMITTPDQRQNVISALCEKDIDNQQTGWERLATKAPQQLQSFIDMITTPDQRQNVISALKPLDTDTKIDIVIQALGGSNDQGWKMVTHSQENLKLLTKPLKEKATDKQKIAVSKTLIRLGLESVTPGRKQQYAKKAIQDLNNKNNLAELYQHHFDSSVEINQHYHPLLGNLQQRLGIKTTSHNLSKPFFDLAQELLAGKLSKSSRPRSAIAFGSAIEARIRPLSPAAP